MEKTLINELIENLCTCVYPDADIERLKREAYEKIKNYADDLAIEFAQHRSSNGFPEKWVLRNELQAFKTLRKVPKMGTECENNTQPKQNGN